MSVLFKEKRKIIVVLILLFSVVIPFIIKALEKDYYIVNCYLFSDLIKRKGKKESIINRKYILEFINQNVKADMAQSEEEKVFLRKVHFPYQDEKHTDFIKISFYFTDSAHSRKYIHNLITKLNHSELIKTKIEYYNKFTEMRASELKKIMIPGSNYPLSDKFSKYPDDIVYLNDNIIKALNSLHEQTEINPATMKFSFSIPSEIMIYKHQYRNSILFPICIILGLFVSNLINSKLK